MFEVRKTDAYVNWLNGLHDMRARARVLARVERLAAGNPGDAAPVGEGVSELRINYGPGYRVYYKQQGRELVILLAGGDKAASQETSRPRCALPATCRIIDEKDSYVPLRCR